MGEKKQPINSDTNTNSDGGRIIIASTAVLYQVHRGEISTVIRLVYLVPGTWYQYVLWPSDALAQIQYTAVMLPPICDECV